MQKKVGNVTIYLNTFRKAEEDTGPHYRGKMAIGQEEFELAIWVNTELNGAPIHLSGQVTTETNE